MGGRPAGGPVPASKLPAGQAASVAADRRVRRLVLTHFSRRYVVTTRFATAAAEVLAGDGLVAEELSRVPVAARGSSCGCSWR